MLIDNGTAAVRLAGQAAQALAVAREHLIGRIRADDLPSLHRDEEIAQALLDNGRVKQINDQHGHEAGDRVQLAAA